MTDPRSAGLVGSLPRTVFLEALHRLSPAHFVEPFRDLHHPLHSWGTMVNGVKRAEEIFDEFVKNLITITRYRTAAGHALEPSEYAHLLDCARAMGNGPLADELWEAMHRERLVPDAVCYGHYMEAKVWDHCYTGPEAYRLRMLPKHYRRRHLDPSKPGWQGYRTAAFSVRAKVLRLFRQMIEDGHLADERAYINVLVASARTGHRPGILHVLKTVWNIDVDALKEQSDASKVPPATPYDPWSALYPSEKLLFAVAHALGITNDITGAIRTIHFISASYDISIPEKVWYELFERAYVHCRTRTQRSPHEDDANQIGRVSLDLVRSLFYTMTSEPYNVTPTLQMWRFMINISIDSGSLEDCKFQLQGAYTLLKQTRKKQTDAREIVLRCLQPALDAAKAQTQAGARKPCTSLFQSPILAEAIQAYDLLRLQVYQQEHIFRSILYVVWRVRQWADTSDEEWRFQERPKLQEEWRDFLPERTRLSYGEHSGELDFKGRSSIKDRPWLADGRIAVRRDIDHTELFYTSDERPLSEEKIWRKLSSRHPYLDKTIAPLDRLFTFQLPPSKEFSESLRKLRGSWAEYPEDHPLSTKNNPTGGFYGRLAALSMLKPTDRGVYLLDDKSWI
ncbi:uncharacterized protein N7459_003178 [Penicillium hispanicum]|uniref:uncharacterized protein n=1 Tax=Penicillium hispanicum TaxID=1080232 RepID=UPI002540EF68|nr:uncharacterized protein N7459_003178 [Penicillium hispanicum]KAJ5587413.1 hypothetical protein N7459_003178 [Penicillium hispanicum]